MNDSTLKSVLKKATASGVIEGHDFLTHYTRNDFAAIEEATRKQLDYLAEQLTKMGFNLECFAEPEEKEEEAPASPEINESFTEFTNFDLELTAKALNYYVFYKGGALNKDETNAADLMSQMMKLELEQRNKKS